MMHIKEGGANMQMNLNNFRYLERTVQHSLLHMLNVYQIIQPGILQIFY